MLQVSKLAFLLEDKPDTVIAGDEYEVKSRLINQGSSEMRLAISAESMQHYRVTLEPAEVTLPSGGTQVVIAKVETDGKVRNRVRDTLQIWAKAVDIRDGGQDPSSTASGDHP